jgi:hypothetical protein
MRDAIDGLERDYGLLPRIDFLYSVCGGRPLLAILGAPGAAGMDNPKESTCAMCLKPHRTNTRKRTCYAHSLTNVTLVLGSSVIGRKNEQHRESCCYLVQQRECLSFTATILMTGKKRIAMSEIEAREELTDRRSGREQYRASVDEIKALSSSYTMKPYPTTDGLLDFIEFALAFPFLFILATVGALRWVRDMARDGRTDEDTATEILSAVGFFGSFIMVGVLVFTDYPTSIAGLIALGLIIIWLLGTREIGDEN